MKLSIAIHKGSEMKELYEAILGEENKVYYLTTFEHFDKLGPGLKASWNWPAFFFGIGWALYRKMYDWFFILLGIVIISEILEEVRFPILSALFFFIPWIAFAVFANSLYQANLRKKIDKAKLRMTTPLTMNIEDESKLLDYLRSKGGVHIWVIWIFFVITIIAMLGILAAILIPMFVGK
jgi:hypothetical protein